MSQTNFERGENWAGARLRSLGLRVLARGRPLFAERPGTRLPLNLASMSGTSAQAGRPEGGPPQALSPCGRRVPPRRLVWIACAAGLAAILLRLPSRTHFPPTWDSVQYVLGILDYDVTLHQPHPPGYYVYIHTAKLLHLLGLSPYEALLTLSLLAGGLTVGLLTWWGGSLLGTRGALGAAVFTLFSPLSWIYAVHGDTYAVGGFFSVLVGYLCWRLLTVRTQPIWPSAIALGLAGGFRPTDAIFLLPLWLWSVRHKRLAETAVGLALFALFTVAWAAPMIADTGGWSTYRAVSGQLGNMVKRLSPLMGNLTGLRVCAVAVVASAWALLLAAWPLTLFARSRYLQSALNEARSWTFLVMWSGPALLFYLAVHFGQGGYMLLALPPAILVVTVGFVRLSELISPGQLWGVLGVIVALNFAFTWSVLITADRRREAGMRELVVACRQFSGSDTVAVTGTRTQGESHAERPLLNFRLGMSLLPQIPVYMFPLESSRLGGGAPNYGYHMRSGRKQPPISLRGVRNLILLDPGLLQLLPPGAPTEKLLDSSLAEVSLVRLEPEASLVLGPEKRLRLTVAAREASSMTGSQSLRR